MVTPNMPLLLPPENAIPITTWISQSDDDELLSLLPFLDALRWTKDVRSILRLRVASPET